MFRITRAALPQAGETLPWHERPMAILDDDYHRLEPVPEWIAKFVPGEWRGTLVIGTQTRFLGEIAQGLNRTGHRWREKPLGRVQVLEAKAFVDQIVHFQACPPDLPRDEVYKLFVDGIRMRRGSGGLWPAQYQATRGVNLDERMKVLVESLPLEARRALSVAVFIGFLYDQSGENRTPIATRSVISDFLTYLDLDQDHLKGSSLL